MSKEEKFEFDIINLKNDLAMEDMYVTDDDVEMLRKYYNNEMSMSEIINDIKNSIVTEV